MKIKTWQGEIPQTDDEGNTYYIDGWYATDGVNTYYGRTESEAVAHIGVPVGTWRR